MTSYKAWAGWELGGSALGQSRTDGAVRPCRSAGALRRHLDVDLPSVGAVLLSGTTEAVQTKPPACWAEGFKCQNNLAGTAGALGASTDELF